MNASERSLILIGFLIAILALSVACGIIFVNMGADIVFPGEDTEETVLQKDSTGAYVDNIENLHRLSYVNYLTPTGDTLTWVTREEPNVWAEGTAEFKDTSGVSIITRYTWVIEPD